MSSLGQDLPDNDMASSITRKALFKVGDLVRFKSSGLRAYVQEIDEDLDDDDDETLSVSYELTGHLEHYVKTKWVEVIPLDNTASRSGQNRLAMVPPSVAALRTGNHRKREREEVRVNVSTASVDTNTNTDTNTSANTSNTNTDTSTGMSQAVCNTTYKKLKVSLRESAVFKNQRHRDDDIHPIPKFLHNEGKDREKGWIRSIISNDNGQRNTNLTSTFLNPKEKLILCFICFGLVHDVNYLKTNF